MPESTDEIPIDINRTDEILRFVRKNPNCTKADVIRYMKGRSSINTTHLILLHLIDNGKINKYEKNIQTHFLTINEDDQFIRFHKMLVDLEKLVDDMYGFISFKREMINFEDNLEDVYENPKVKKLFVGLEGIENSYRQSFSLITLLLFREIVSRDGSFQSILFYIINRINSRLSMHHWDKKTSNELLLVSTKNLEASFKAYNNQVKIKTDMGDRLINAVENFKKEVLNIKWIDTDDLPLAQKKKLIKALKNRTKETAKREKDRSLHEKSD